MNKRQQKAQEEANLANARIDLTRYEKLIAAKYASHQQYSTQKALVQQLEAQVRADQAALIAQKLPSITPLFALLLTAAQAFALLMSVTL